MLLPSHDLLFPVHRLTGWKARPYKLRSAVCGPRSILRSAVRRPYSFIRSPFVDGLPTRQEERGLTAEVLESLLNGE